MRRVAGKLGRQIHYHLGWPFLVAIPSEWSSDRRGRFHIVECQQVYIRGRATRS